MSRPGKRNIFVTGGAGYVGSVLVPKLLRAGHEVKVVDLYIYGDDTLDSVRRHPGLIQVKGDIRSRDLLAAQIRGCDTVIHLACISNDPSYELDPELGRSINYDAFVDLVDIAKNSGVKQFIYASSSSVYGIKNEPAVTEDLPLEPLTDYSMYKAKCEEVLLGGASDSFIVTVLRPSTACGYSPRMRLDLTVNILTNHAVNRGLITVFGGDQKRPSIHVEDMADAYLFLLSRPAEMIQKKIYNIGCQNHTVIEIAHMVKRVLGADIPIEVVPSDDRRSYHISSDRIRKELGYTPVRTIEEAVTDLKNAFASGRIPNPMTDIRYYNIKTMQAVKLR